MNKVILAGRIGESPKLQNGVAKFPLATEYLLRRDGKTYKDERGFTAKGAEWHRITCFSKLAEIAMELVQKGDLFTVEGRIQYGKYEKDGVTHYTTEIVAEDIKLLSRPSA